MGVMVDDCSAVRMFARFVCVAIVELFDQAKIAASLGFVPRRSLARRDGRRGVEEPLLVQERRRVQP